ncbi:PREDICTED: 65-kDa microtubule-associated protein 6-like isoform X1 [Nelumbo nucifera]|uniref:65-kDa microtubule-associated protein 6-like isoform X1 n=2 Tax=Nelumbo nucifera TaxID=4432 RepID=A0A1U7Z4I5_NELNU|nr:PREDICTED: 65-kDa microtubule-associated protein 6-like isoform X1 [Nelumbo nucifera]
MQALGSPTSACTDTSCGALLRELQHVWDEIGESEADKDRMLLELEKECLQVYRRKVHEASNNKARLHQSVAAKEAELATLMAALGELNLRSQVLTDKRSASLKEQLASVLPLVEDLRMKKEERIKQIADVKAQIEKIRGEVSGYTHLNGVVTDSLNTEEQDLSQRKLTEYQTHLHSLQKEKSDRLHKVLEYVNEVHSLCGVLGMDFGRTVSEVHPSLHDTGHEQSTNISNSTLEGLEKAILKLKAERKSRFQKLKDIVASLFELWNLMDSPQEERNLFRRVTSVFQTPELETTKSSVLSLEIIEQAASEVERLTKLKASRMKELVMKKRSELEEICRKAHIEPDMSTAAEKANALIDSGLVDPSELLANIEVQITKMKDEAVSRKEIMDRIDRWLAACEEENWLEDYNQDENRYSAGRGVHFNLKRAEKARVTVTKIPSMIENLINKILAWEDERKMLFLYDGVRLIQILEDYKLTRQQKEEEKRRYRDQKKFQDLLLTEKEAMYGSKPSPKRSNSFKKPNGYRANGNGSMTPTPQRLSVGSATPELLTPRSYSGRQNGYFKETRRLSTAPLNFVAISKEDTMSYASGYGSELGSPRSHC